MRSTRLLLVVLLIGFVQAQAQTPQAANQSAESARVERLVGLAKIWGTVKFFHPYLAYREVDWDNALVATIPQVNAAKTPQGYNAAINSMLAVLNDKNTRAQVVTERPKADSRISTAQNNEPVLENGVLMIDIMAVATTNSGSFELMDGAIAKTNQLLPQAKSVLIDLRSSRKLEDDTFFFFLDYYFHAVLTAMLDRDVTLASLRYRLHNGYAPQVGVSSGGYYSALTTAAPLTLNGNNKTKTPRLVFLVNEHSPEAEILSGLQAAKVAFVIQDGVPTTEIGMATTTIKLPDNVEVTMRKAELANPDGTIGFAADAIAPQGEARPLALRLIAENKFVSNRPKPTSAFAAQVSQKEKPYVEMEFPTTEHRLLALFRFWTIIHYFFPYKDLQDAPWESVLPKFIPKFEANKDAGDYQLTVREMAAEVQDSHVRVGNAQKSLDHLGRFSPPFYAKFIEGQSVVVRILDESSGIKPGDTILTVDGEAAEKYREKLSRYFSASTPQAMQRLLHLNFLRGPKDSKSKLSVRSLDGKVREVEIVRSVANDDPRLLLLFSHKRTTPVVAVLPSGFGYVDLARLTIAEVDKMFETIKPTSATIFDMRGYPNGTAWEIAPRLTEKKSPVAALFSRPILDATLLGIPDYGKTNFTFEQPLPEAKGEIYKGKVVMLINEEAISQAEGTCMFFQVATDVTFIGTPTMGANGDVTDTILPGNLTVRFTGHNVRHADGRQLQRIGIQPHIRVAPTIRGTLEVRDEILEAAIKFLQASRLK